MGHLHRPLLIRFLRLKRQRLAFTAAGRKGRFLQTRTAEETVSTRETDPTTGFVTIQE